MSGNLGNIVKKFVLNATILGIAYGASLGVVYGKTLYDSKEWDSERIAEEMRATRRDPQIMAIMPAKYWALERAYNSKRRA